MPSLFNKILQGFLICLAMAALSACDSSSNTAPTKPGHKVEDPAAKQRKRIQQLKVHLETMEKKLTEYNECLAENEEEDCAAIASELNSISDAFNNKKLDTTKD